MNLKKIADEYNIKVFSIEKSKGNYILETDKGKKELIECKFSPGKIMFQHLAKEHLFQNGFQQIIRYDVSQSEKPYFEEEAENKHYVLQDKYEYKECDLKKEQNIENAVKTLAKLHKCSEGFIVSDDIKAKNEIGDIDLKFQSKLEEMAKLKDKAKKKQSLNSFDYMFMNNIEYNVELGRKAIEILKSVDFHKIEQKELEAKGFCHYDYGNNNLLIDNSNNIIISDMYYCGYQLRVYDIAGLIKRLVKDYNWDEKLTVKIIEYYNEINNLGIEDIKILIAMLTFPQKFWKVVNKYYNGNRYEIYNNYEVQMNYLLEKKENHKEYIDKLLEIYN